MSMTALPQPAQDVIALWRDEGNMPGFFRWLEEIGRKDEEIKEIAFDVQERETTWDRILEIDGPPMVRTFAPTGNIDISITFTDMTTVQRRFTHKELTT
jgi:hypothetical protein